MKKLILYLIITFLWSWLFWLPCIISPTGRDELPFFIFFIIGAFGPFVGAHSVIFLNEGKEGIKNLWKRFLNIKIKPIWLLIIIGLIPAIMLCAFLIPLLTGAVAPPISFSWLTFILFFTIFLYGGPFNEEFGWRGYALERFQEKWSSLNSSIILGIIWGFWHLPLFFMMGSSQEGQPFILFLMMTTLLSILFTWIYNNTKGNIFAVMLFHCIFNFTHNIIPFSYSILGILSFGIILSITTMIIIIYFKAETLTREKT